MHNDVKQCFRGSNLHCGSCSNERINMASNFPEAGNLNGSNADKCSDVAGPSSTSPGDLFDFRSSSCSRMFTISPTTSTAGRHLAFECDCNCLSGRVAALCIRTI